MSAATAVETPSASAPPATRESLEWFRKSRERWQQTPRRRIQPLSPVPPPITDNAAVLQHENDSASSTVRPLASTTLPAPLSFTSTTTPQAVVPTPRTVPDKTREQTDKKAAGDADNNDEPRKDDSVAGATEAGSTGPAFSAPSFGFGSVTSESSAFSFSSQTETSSKRATTFSSLSDSWSKTQTPFGLPGMGKADNSVTSPFGTDLGLRLEQKKGAEKTGEAPVRAAESSHRHRLHAFYTKHNPDKLSSLDETLQKYAGREDELFARLEAKYGTQYPAPIGNGPVTFLEFELSPSAEKGVIKIQLFEDKTPIAAENFRCLCTGEKGIGRSGKLLCYRNNEIHRIVPNMCIQGGDITAGDGTGGESIYEPGSSNPKTDLWGNFADETFLGHTEEGLLSMANNGKDRNSSQFFVTLKNLSYLNGKHVVFGKVVDGMDIIRRIGNLGTDAKERPLNPVKISDCGEIKVQNGKETWIRASEVSGAKTLNPSTGFSIAPPSQIAATSSVFESTTTRLSLDVSTGSSNAPETDGRDTLPANSNPFSSEGSSLASGPGVKEVPSFSFQRSEKPNESSFAFGNLSNVAEKGNASSQSKASPVELHRDFVSTPSDAEANLPTVFCSPLSGWKMPAVPKEEPHSNELQYSSEKESPVPAESDSNNSSASQQSSGSSSDSSGDIGPNVRRNAVETPAASILAPSTTHSAGATSREEENAERSSTPDLSTEANESSYISSPSCSTSASTDSSDATGPIDHMNLAQAPFALQPRSSARLETTEPVASPANTSAFSFADLERTGFGAVNPVATPKSAAASMPTGPDSLGNTDANTSNNTSRDTAESAATGPDIPVNNGSLSFAESEATGPILSQSVNPHASPSSSSDGSEATGPTTQQQQNEIASPVQVVSIMSPPMLDEECSGEVGVRLAAGIPVQAKAVPHKVNSPLSPHWSEEGSVKTDGSCAVNGSIASVESSVAERIECLQRDIEDSTEQLEATKQKVEEQQALLDSRQQGLQHTAIPKYSRTLQSTSYGEGSPARIPSPFRNASLTQAQSTSIVDTQNASRGALELLNSPSRSVQGTAQAGALFVSNDDAGESPQRQPEKSDQYDYQSAIAMRMRSSPNRDRARKSP